VNAGVVVTVTSPYHFRTGIDAVADLYVFAGSAGAARVFDSEPAVGSAPATVGDAARVSSSSLTFRKGRCLVRLVAYSQGPEVPEALTALARAIERGL
jgi:hypothetical protein